jgi:hypothetical protein
MTGRSCSFTMRLTPEGSRTARIRSIRAFEEFRIDFVRQTFCSFVQICTNMGTNKEISTRRPGKWLPFLVCGTIAACLVFGAATSAFAQHVSVGIKVGAPLTDVVKAEPGPVPFLAQTKHYTIGPVIDIRLPLGLGIEAGAMYKRFDQQSQTITTTGYIFNSEESFPIQQRGSIAAVGKSLEFPVVAQYHFSISSMRPYVEGGVSFNHLSNVFNSEEIYRTQGVSVPFTLSPKRSSFDRAGLLFGTG